jgi:glycosyltransferase involved in cell wall biosynthesis
MSGESDLKISILMPVFNTAPYLQECLHSILQQTEPDWELVAVDDFSTDESAAILLDFAQRDARIKVFTNTKKGIAPALKLAFQQSGGALVTRMDSDDRMLSQKLASLKKVLLQHGHSHVATGKVRYFSETGLGEGYQRYAAWLNGLAEQQNHWSDLYRECVVPSPCWMAWRQDLLDCQAFTTENYPEDYDLCFRWRQAGFRVVAEQAVLHEWRDHPDRTSRTNERYRDHAYLDLKTSWFLRLDHDPGRPLVLWGAGRKGKRIAEILSETQTPFHWVCNNPKKWGKAIYGVHLFDYQGIASLESPQWIIAVAERGEQENIKNYLLETGRSKKEGLDVFFFC